MNVMLSLLLWGWVQLGIASDIDAWVYFVLTDYETAAAHIHRFLAMDETLLLHSADEGNKGVCRQLSVHVLS